MEKDIVRYDIYLWENERTFIVHQKVFQPIIRSFFFNEFEPGNTRNLRCNNLRRTKCNHVFLAKLSLSCQAMNSCVYGILHSLNLIDSSVWIL